MISLVRAESHDGKERLNALASRRVGLEKATEAAVAKILKDVRLRGDRALLKYVRRYDAPGLRKSSLRVGPQELEKAYGQIDEGFQSTLSKAIRQIEEFHSKQREQSWIVTRENGTLIGQLVRPLDVAGLYVPGGQGGKTPLVSSVLMNGIPARMAGVPRVVLTTPPCLDGSVNPYLLVAAQQLGITEIYKAGSAWGIAGLAFGTETLPRVDIIVGPGNVYVTLAKKLLSGMVGIDMIAGPSEILVVADDTADAEAIAADLLSQAEHDAMATAILVTTSVKLAHAVVSFLKKQLKTLARSETALASLEQNGIIFLVKDAEEAVALINCIAPEHLELMVDEPFSWLGQIRHAGAIFLGHYSPEPMGDYVAGPNHVLPTMGTARHSSALGVGHFLKKTSLIYYTKKGFVEDAGDVVRMAELEGLTAHARAVSVRLDK